MIQQKNPSDCGILFRPVTGSHHKKCD